MARPKKEINDEFVYELAKIHCTMIEIAHVCDCSVDTLERRFADVIKKGRSEGKMSLRRLQYDAAKTGNIGMLIWLGKQLLDQHERTVIDISKLPDEVIKDEILRRYPEDKLKSA